MKRKRIESNVPALAKKRKIISQKELFNQFWNHLCQGPPEKVLEDAQTLRLKTRNDKTRAWNFVWSSMCPFNDEKQVLEHLVDTKDELTCYTGLTRIARINFDLARRIHKFYISTRKNKVCLFSAPNAVILKKAIPDKAERIQFLNVVIWSKFKGDFYNQDRCDMSLELQKILFEATRVEFYPKPHKFSNFSDLVCEDLVLQYFRHDLIEDTPLFFLNCHNSDPRNAITNLLFSHEFLIWPIFSSLSIMFSKLNQQELKEDCTELSKSFVDIQPFDNIDICPHCGVNITPTDDEEVQIRADSKVLLQYFEIHPVQQCCSRTNVYIINKNSIIGDIEYKVGFEIVERENIISRLHTSKLEIHKWINNLLVDGVSNIVIEYALFVF